MGGDLQQKVEFLYSLMATGHRFVVVFFYLYVSFIPSIIVA